MIVVSPEGDNLIVGTDTGTKGMKDQPVTSGVPRGSERARLDLHHICNPDRSSIAGQACPAFAVAAECAT
jgi:hypothetical protein